MIEFQTEQQLMTVSIRFDPDCSLEDLRLYLDTHDPILTVHSEQFCGQSRELSKLRQVGPGWYEFHIILPEPPWRIPARFGVSLFPEKGAPRHVFILEIDDKPAT